MKLLINCTVIMLTAILLSCGKNNSANHSAIANMELENVTGKSEPALADSAAPGNGQTIVEPKQSSPQTDWDKKIIKTANITLELKEYNPFNSGIHGMVKRFGAYISSEQQTQSDYKIENTVSVKVPVSQFEELLNALPVAGVKVVDKKISSEDVSEEMVDTKARIEARKQVRDRYLDLLKQAKTMKDILQVQQEINGIQEEIEAGSGRVQYLTHQAAFSTINITYYQLLSTAQPNDNMSPSFAARLNEAFKNGSSILTGLLVCMVTFWPFLIAGIALLFLLKRKKWRTQATIKTQ